MRNYNQNLFMNEFISGYAEILGKRADSFNRIFEYLNSRNKQNYTIVETGTVRMENNFIGDGCSTILFDKYVSQLGGTVYTVDINSDACAVSRRLTSNNTIVVLGDSVSFLNKFRFPHEIDLLYLDSFDFDAENPHPSSFHHMKELATIWAKLTPGCLIVVDDNFEDGKGKGTYVKDFLINVGGKLLFDDYQLGFIKVC